GSPHKAFAVAAYAATFAQLLGRFRIGTMPALAVAQEGVRRRHLLLYADDPSVEEAIHAVGADAAIAQGGGDYLYVVDTNTSRNKVNELIDERVAYQAVVQPDRGILATTTITYTSHADVHNAVNRQGGQPTYSDFLRVFVPAGSTLFS